MDRRNGRGRSGALSALAALAVAVAGCGPGAAPAGSAPAAAPANQAAPPAPPSGASAPAAAGSEAPASGAAAQASATAAPVKVKMAFTALAGSFMPIWVAQEAGLFTQNGVDAEISYIGNSPTAMAGLIAGEVDMLVGAPDAGIAAAVDGADVVSVGTLLNKIVQAIYAAPGYTDPTSLRGHSVGITRFGALSDSAVRYLLRRWNLEPERDVTLRQIGGFPEMVAALSANGIEAGILAPPHTLRAKELGFVELGNLWTTPLEYPAIVFNARKQRTAEQDERVRRVLRTAVEGVHRTRTDQPLATKVLVEFAKSEDPRANDEAYEVYTPLFERDLKLSTDAYKTALDEMARSKPQAASVDLETLMDKRFIDEIAASGLVDRIYR
jgi:ABC-type nitrate/sulfonate/bicarbonate transport system substrate-binding protein